MAIGTKERTELRGELVAQGYSWEYIDSWQPKSTYYRHRPQVSPTGEIISPVGTALQNLPGNPDYANKKAKIGLFQRRPSDDCTCRWGQERQKTAEAPTLEATGKGKRAMGPHYDGS